MTEAVKFVASVGLNLILLSICWFLFQRQRRFKGQFDPKVCVYINARKWSGWVTTISGDPDCVRTVRHAQDASVYRLSEIKADLNLLIHRGLYVRVCRIVHPEHWKEKDNER